MSDAALLTCPCLLSKTLSETRRIAVVKIDKLEYENSSGAWVDATSGIIYVSQGTTLNFKAVPTPLVWPDGMPVWSGTSGASGGGETKSVTFDTVSASSSDFKTVTVTCGNTKSARIIVIKVNTILPSSQTVSIGTEMELQIETLPSGYYDMVSATVSGATILNAYDPSTGKIKVRFDQVSSTSSDYKTVMATCGMSSLVGQALVVKVESITPASQTVSIGTETELQVETIPVGRYNMASVAVSGAAILSDYDPSTGKIKVRFDQVSSAISDYKIVTATCGTSSKTAQTLTVKVDVKAKDLSVHGSSNVREAGVGQVLHLVKEQAFATQTAKITASSEGLTFEAGEPTWGGQTSGNNGDINVYYSSDSGGGGIVSATAWGLSKNVEIAIDDKNETTIAWLPVFDTLDDALTDINGHIAIPGGTFSVAITPSISGSRWTVEKPNSPDTTKSYKGAVSVKGELTGTIMAPVTSGWSGQFPPAWVPGDPWALWQTFASATIGVEVEGHAEYKNEYNPSQLEFDGSGSISGDLKVGVYAVAQVAGYTGEGEANVAAGISYTVTVEGASPNKKIMGEFGVQPVTLNAELTLVRDSDDETMASASYSRVIRDGWTQNPKSTLYSQPANP